jgi:benzoyl-CoA reductase/2-hydroxyglutaryl-CoA dehydratase subunit BcrC/BadD/HgdB
LKTVLYDSPFVPAEWIAAHGLEPHRILPVLSVERRNVSPTDGVCPYARAFLGTVNAAPAAAVIFATSCDQMRRASELASGPKEGRASFLMDVPTSWQTETARHLYVTELERLGRFLERLGGQRPTDDHLAEVMRKYNSGRSLLRAAGGRLPARMLADATFEFHRTGIVPVEILQHAAKSSGVKRKTSIALVGSPLMANNLSLIDVIEANGGEVVLDATTSGERSFPAPFDGEQLETDPFRALAEAYFNTIPEAFRRPNTQLYEWLETKLADCGARGLIFFHYVWCDTWHGEAQRMKNWTQLPVLALEAGDELQLSSHTVSRIQAFLEMLSRHWAAPG